MTLTGKQRLLGFLVIASLGIVFLPMLFDGAGYNESKHFRVDIPTPPEPMEFKSYTTEQSPLADTKAVAEPRPQPQPVSVIEKSQSAPEQATPVATPEVKLNAAPTEKTDPKATASNNSSLRLDKEKPVLDVQGVPVAWTLQLAAFKEKSNATELSKRLISKGYKAYVRTKDNLHKVYVGPDVQRTEIEVLRTQLKREFKLDGLILRFTAS